MIKLHHRTQIRFTSAWHSVSSIRCTPVNSSSPGQNGRHFADDSFKCIFLNENIWIAIKISLKFVPRGPMNNIPALVQIMAWRRIVYIVSTYQNMIAIFRESIIHTSWFCHACYVGTLKWRLRRTLYILYSIYKIYTRIYCALLCCGHIISSCARHNDDVMKWKHFPVTGPLCGEFTGHRWIPLTKASDAELWCFLWFAPEQMVE